MFTYRGIAADSCVQSKNQLPRSFNEAEYGAHSARLDPDILPLAERVLSGMVAQRISPAAICALLEIEQDELDQRLAALSLSRPPERPDRKARKSAWVDRETRALIRFWSHNYSTALMSRLLSRTENAVRGKARRLGLFKRDRALLTSEPTKWETWSERAEKRQRLDRALKLSIRDRWVGGQTTRGIVRDFGLTMTAAALSTACSRLGLPRRGKKDLSDRFDPSRPPDPEIARQAIELVCSISKDVFFGTRGQRYSPMTRKSVVFRDLCSASAFGCTH